MWEASRHIDTAVVDKTGTLTYGRPSVRAIEVSEMSETSEISDTDEVLEIASILAEKSLHPLSQAIAREQVSQREENGEKPETTNEHIFNSFVETPGAGVIAEFKNGSIAALGASSLFSDIHGDLEQAALSAANEGFTSVFVGWDNKNSDGNHQHPHSNRLPNPTDINFQHTAKHLSLIHI